MISMNAFQDEPAELRSAERCAVEKVLDSNSFIMGAEGVDFERAWARFCGARFCVGVANGTDAIEIGLRALGIGAGDEVITTPMTAMATIMAILRTGALPVLADIHPDTALLDMESVQSRLTPKTRALVLVHLYGHARELNRWKIFCAEEGIALLEDCAQSHGAEWNGQKAGTFGEIGAFSFYPTKNLGARGDAGALITDSEAIAERARSLRNYGSIKRNEHERFGCNSRLDEVQAAILLVRLAWLERFNARRKEIGERYFCEIKNPVLRLMALPTSPENHVYHLFVLKCGERERLSAFLKTRGVESLVHYPIPAHRQPFWKQVTASPVELPQAEKHAGECLSIPCHPQLSNQSVSTIIEALNDFS